MSSSIIYIYNSFNDPLFQNLMYRYLDTLTSKNHLCYLITFEQPEFALTEEEYKLKKIELKKRGIVWKPATHSTGKFLLLKKLKDLVSVFFTILNWRLKGTKNIIAFANVSASHSVIYSTIMGLRLFVYSYEPHAEFQVELGLWKPNSLKFKLLNYFEQLAAKKAHLIFTGTKYGVELVKSISPKTAVFRLPTSVDENEFQYRRIESENWKKEHQIQENKIVLYLGKFGDLYYEPKVLIKLYEALIQIDPSYFFIIITSYDLQKIKALINDSKTLVESHFYLDQRISYDQVKVMMSVADIGMSIVPPMENQKYRSPTKVAEYLLCGLPFITCQGVSEDDILGEKFDVGLGVKDITPDTAHLIDEKTNLWIKEADKVRTRCREAGISYRGKSNVDKAFEELLIPELQ